MENGIVRPQEMLEDGLNLRESVLQGECKYI